MGQAFHFPNRKSGKDPVCGNLPEYAPVSFGITMDHRAAAVSAETSRKTNWLPESEKEAEESLQSLLTAKKCSDPSDQTALFAERNQHIWKYDKSANNKVDSNRSVLYTLIKGV